MADEIQVNLTSTTVSAGGVYSGDTVAGAANLVDTGRLTSAQAVGAIQESQLADAVTGAVLTIGGTLTGARTVTAPDASLTLAGQDFANAFTVGQQFPLGSSSTLGVVFGAAANASNRTGFYGDLTASAEKVAMVVGGQTGPTWTRNGTAVDLALTGALSGATTITGATVTATTAFRATAGSISTPSLSFTADTTTGIYRSGSGQMGHVFSGTEVLRMSGTAFLWSRNTSVAIGVAPVNAVGSVSFHGSDATQFTLAMCSYGAAAVFLGRRCEGTAASPTATASGSGIWAIQIEGYEGTTPAFTSAKAAYSIIARETWTSAAQGYAHVWDTTLSGTTTNAEKMRLENSGNLLIGTTTDGMTAAGSLAVAKDFAHRGTKLGVFNATPVSQITGYGTPTNGAKQASFDATTITLPNLAAAVAQLINDFKSYGHLAA